MSSVDLFPYPVMRAAEQTCELLKEARNRRERLLRAELSKPYLRWGFRHRRTPGEIADLMGRHETNRQLWAGDQDKFLRAVAVLRIAGAAVREFTQIRLCAEDLAAISDVYNDPAFYKSVHAASAELERMGIVTR